MYQTQNNQTQGNQTFANPMQFNPGQSAGAGWQQNPAGSQAGQYTGAQGTANFGANEIMKVHEVLTDIIDGINEFELLRPHVKDQRLMQILDSQVNHQFSSYQNLVNFLHNRGGGSAVPYRVPKAPAINYGLRQPSPEHPNVSLNEMNDRDVASILLGCAKASAVLYTGAALECVDPQLRSMMTNNAVSAINQAYEVFQFMHEKGMYQIPTLEAKTTQTMLGTFQVGGQPQMR